MLQLLKKEPVIQVDLQPSSKPVVFMNKEEVITCIREIEQAIARNEALFNLVSEEDLISACILERKALEHRYQYYHKIARRQGIQCPISHFVHSLSL